MAEEDVLKQIEDTASFYERQIIGRTKENSKMSTTLLLGHVMVLMTKALIIHTKELRKINGK